MDRNHFHKAVTDLLGKEEVPLLSEQEERSLYASAYDLYERKEYRKASPLFTRLVLVNPFFAPYWKGLAAAKQMTRDYEQALLAWSLSAILDANDATLHLHAAECLHNAGEQEEAIKALAYAATLDPSLEAYVPCD